MGKTACQNKVGTFRGAYHGSDGIKVRAFPLSCGTWNCPDCRETKSRGLWARCLAGGLMERVKTDGFREKYFFKLLTLTCPGKQYRLEHTPGEAFKEMSEAFTGLVKYLGYHLAGEFRPDWTDGKRGAVCPSASWGREYSFEYLRVVELQQDGYPHFHVVLVGDAITHKSVLRIIEDYWRGVHGMGFVNLRSGNTAEGAIKYVLKYMFKMERFGDDMKGSRRYAASREVLAAKEPGEKDYIWSKVELRPVGRFFGIEYGRVCLRTDEEGFIDELVPVGVGLAILNGMGDGGFIQEERREKK